MVVAEVLATFKNFTTLDKVVFTGGGASIIDKQLVKIKFRIPCLLKTVNFLM